MTPVIHSRSRHAEPEELVAYRAKRLGDDEVERLRDHLALCPECTELLLDLASFEEIEPRLGVTPVTPDREMVEDYAALMAVAEPRAANGEVETGEIETGMTDGEAVYLPLPWTRTILPWAVVALMAVVAIGSWVQTSRLRQTARESGQNFPIYAYGEPAVSRGEGAASQDVVLVIPLLPAIQPESFPTYELEIRDLQSQGKVVEGFTGLVPNNTSQLAVRLDRELLDYKRYRFDLYGRKDDGSREYLKLQPPRM